MCPTIEPPIKTNVSWSGHRFSLNAVLSGMTPSPGSGLGRLSSRLERSPSSRLPIFSASKSHRKGDISESHTIHSAGGDADSDCRRNFSEVNENIAESNQRCARTTSDVHDKAAAATDAETKLESREEDTMIGVDTGSAHDTDEIAIVMGTFSRREAIPSKFVTRPW